MPRILGVDIPNNKKVPYSLAALFGIGLDRGNTICESCQIDVNKRAYQPDGGGARQDLHLHRVELRDRGQPAARDPGQRRPLQGDRLLPRLPPRAQPALPRPAHAHQLAHAQGQEEDRRQQEDPAQVTADRARHRAAHHTTRNRVEPWPTTRKK